MFLTSQKQVVCSVDLKANTKKQRVAKNKYAQSTLKNCQMLFTNWKSTAPSDIDNSNALFSRAIYQAAAASAKRKSLHWLINELYLLHEQLKAEYFPRKIMFF